MKTYKYKLYNNKHNKEFAQLLLESSFVWNHCLAMQKRYYKLYKKYIPCAKLQSYFAKHYKMENMGSQTVQEIIQRLDTSYQRFFKKTQKRPPKFKKGRKFTSFMFKQNVGFSLNGNTICINKLKRVFKFSLSRKWEGNVKTVSIKRDTHNDYYVIIVTDAVSAPIVKTHNGACIGVDYGLKTYLTLSNGEKYNSPQFFKEYLPQIRRAHKRVSLSKKGSNNHKKHIKELNALYKHIIDLRNNYQWELAHELCRRFDYIFIEDLCFEGMKKRWGRKINDLSHASFIRKLEYVALRYGVIVHKIDRYYASSRLCECGYKNSELKLSDRTWKCPVCGKEYDRDIHAAENILREGIHELQSNGKTISLSRDGSCVTMQESHGL